MKSFFGEDIEPETYPAQATVRNLLSKFIIKLNFIFEWMGTLIKYTGKCLRTFTL